MAGPIRVSVACSLDGFLAGPDNDLSWLPTREEGEDYGYRAFLAQTTAILMGRVTYDVAAGFDAWPYGNLPVFVATSRPLDPIVPAVHAIRGTPAGMLATVRKHTDGQLVPRRRLIDLVVPRRRPDRRTDRDTRGGHPRRWFSFVCWNGTAPPTEPQRHHQLPKRTRATQLYPNPTGVISIHARAQVHHHDQPRRSAGERVVTMVTLDVRSGSEPFGRRARNP